jgi:tetratricopeptide (TPR) repeat protein
VTKFLVDLLRSARPDESRGGAMTVREAVDLGRDRILKNLSDEPEIRADIIGTLGSVYGSLGELAEGRVLKDKALALRQQGDATDRPELAADILGLAKAHYDLGEYEAAELQFRQALATRRRLGVVDEDFVTFVFNLAAVLVQRGKSEEAESLHLEALELRKTLFGPEDRRVASSLIGLGALYRNRGDLARAEEHFRQALKIRVETLGEKNTRVARVYNSLGWTQHLRGEHGAAEDSFERALAIRQAILGKAHPETARTKKNLASLALDRGEIDRAEVLINEALVDLRRALPEGDWTLAEAESVLGGCLVARGRFAESEEYLLRSYRIIEAVRSSDSRSAQEALGRILELYAAWGKDEELARYQALAEGKTATFRIGGE